MSSSTLFLVVQKLWYRMLFLDLATKSFEYNSEFVCLRLFFKFFNKKTVFIKTSCVDLIYDFKTKMKKGFKNKIKISRI